jgi:hypothetical protein
MKGFSQVYIPYDSGLVLYNLFTNILCIKNVIIIINNLVIMTIMERLEEEEWREDLLSSVLLKRQEYN